MWGGRPILSDTTCSVETCQRPGGTRGWCHAHYMRWYQTGDVRADEPLQIYGDDEARWLSKVDKEGPEHPILGRCWLWTGPVVHGVGYANFKLRDRHERAHRWGYEHFVMALPDGVELDHLCHTFDSDCPAGLDCGHRRCVNPHHLQPVTPDENIRRGYARRLDGAA